MNPISQARTTGVHFIPRLALKHRGGDIRAPSWLKLRATIWTAVSHWRESGVRYLSTVIGNFRQVTCMWGVAWGILAMDGGWLFWAAITFLVVWLLASRTAG
jgi:hypothetical protein